MSKEEKFYREIRLLKRGQFDKIKPPLLERIKNKLRKILGIIPHGKKEVDICDSENLKREKKIKKIIKLK